MRRLVTVSDVTTAANESLVGSVYVAEPGCVLAYDPVKQTATVQPVLADVRFNVDSGQPFAEAWPVLYNVPVMWPRGNGATLQFALKANDTVTLEAWDFDPSGITVPGSAVIMPADVRKLAGHAWRAVPQAYAKPLPSLEAAAAAAGFLLGLIGDPAQIRGAPGSLKLGAQAVIPVALATPLGTVLQALSTYVQGVTTAAGVGSAAPDPTGVAFQTFCTTVQALGAAATSAISAGLLAIPAKVVTAQ